jgi:hypothetical protein
MFRWYQKASICYAYLFDVKDVSQLPGSRWFTRGWTLQELIAPVKVWFYNSDWNYLGSKRGLREEIQQITNIETQVLETGVFTTVSIARRMSWAARRRTTRIEDQAYALMGIFDVNMPLLYGEGEKAFIRLQEEIMKTSDDQSIFAWGLPAEVKTMREYLNTTSAVTTAQMRGPFARSPSEFTFSDRIHVLEDPQSTVPPIVFNNGVRIELQVKRPKQTQVQFAVIYCTMHGKYKHYLAFPILAWGGKWVARCGELVAIAVSDLVTPNQSSPYRKPSVLLIKAPVQIVESWKPTNILKMMRVANKYTNHYTLEDVHCSAHATWSSADQTLALNEEKDALHAVFYFDPARSEVSKLMTYPPQVVLSECKCGAYLQNRTREKDYFIVEAKKETHHDKYFAMHPSFAVLVGGIGANSWAEVVVILSDDDTDASFQRLQNADGQLVRSCTTKNHLLSIIQQDTSVEPLCGHRQQHEPQQVLSWNYQSGCSKYYAPTVLSTKERGRLSVSAQIQMVSSSLVEHSLTLFIEVMEKEDQKANQLPVWWGFGDES